MPKVEDFPVIAQRQMEQAGMANNPDEEHRPRGLLARLAQGLSKRDDETDTAIAAETPGGNRPVRMDVEPRAGRPTDRVATPNPRRIGQAANPSGKLDSHGRAAVHTLKQTVPAC